MIIHHAWQEANIHVVSCGANIGTASYGDDSDDAMKATCNACLSKPGTLAAIIIAQNRLLIAAIASIERLFPAVPSHPWRACISCETLTTWRNRRDRPLCQDCANLPDGHGG